MKTTILWVFIFLMSCSSADHKLIKSSIDIKISDLKAYTEELNSKEPYTTPFVSTFEKNELRLDFVAADHVEGNENSTCKTIKNLFDQHEPKFLLVEGWAFSQINDPEQIAEAQRCEKSGYKGCGEDTCAVNFALSKKIPFNYAEPNDESIKKYVLETGYTERELLFFYGLRQIPQYIRKGIVDKKSIQKSLVQFLEKSGSRRLKVALPLMTLKEFETIFYKKLKRKIVYEKIDTEVVSPRVDNKPEWSNKLSYVVGQAREQHISQMIQQRVNEYGHVMIVYGAGHLVKERSALENAFGKVRNYKYY